MWLAACLLTNVTLTSWHRLAAFERHLLTRCALTLQLNAIFLYKYENLVSNSEGEHSRKQVQHLGLKALPFEWAFHRSI